MSRRRRTGRRDRDLPRRARVPDGGAPAHPHAGLLPGQHLELPCHPGVAVRAGARLAAGSPRAIKGGRAPPDRDPAGAGAAGTGGGVHWLLRGRERVLPRHSRVAGEPVRGRGAPAGLLGHLPSVVRDPGRAAGPVLRPGRGEHRAAVLLRPGGRGVGLPACAAGADLGRAAARHHDGAVRALALLAATPLARRRLAVGAGGGILRGRAAGEPRERVPRAPGRREPVALRAERLRPQRHQEVRVRWNDLARTSLLRAETGRQRGRTAWGIVQDDGDQQREGRTAGIRRRSRPTSCRTACTTRCRS